MKTLHRRGDFLSNPARLLEIDRRLREGRHPSHSSLARDLGVSTRTIQRDTDYLRYTIGAPLEYDARRRGWRYTEETFFLPSVLASAQDLRALAFLGQAIGQYDGTPFAEAARRAFALIERALPERERLAARWVESKVAFTDFPAAQIDEGAWNAILEGLRTQHSLAMTYAKPGGKAERRRVDPWGLIVSDGDWYLHAWDHKTASRRTFLVARVRGAEVTEDAFQIAGGFDLHAYVRKGFAGLQADAAPVRTVRITFTKRASPLAAERRWHRDQKESWDAQGRLTVVFQASALFRVRRQLHRWASEIVRCEPRELLAGGGPGAAV